MSRYSRAKSIALEEAEALLGLLQGIDDRSVVLFRTAAEVLRAELLEQLARLSAAVEQLLVEVQHACGEREK